MQTKLIQTGVFVIVTVVLILTSLSAYANEKNPYVDYREKTYNIQIEYLKKISLHQEKIMQDMETTLDQQKWQTFAIAIMVFIMVSVGLYLSYLQFRLDQSTGGKSPVTVRLGSGEVEISSPVIGLVILFLSFWFFQTYVDHVYNVNAFKIPPIDFTTFGVNR